MGQIEASISSHRTETTALGSKLDRLVTIPTSHNIDCARETTPCIHACRSSLKHLDTLDISYRYGQIHREMPRVRIADIHTIEQDDDLVKLTAVDTNVRLYTKSPALTDVHARDRFQQVVDTLCPRLLYILSGEHRNNSRRLQLSQRSHACRDGKFVEFTLVTYVINQSLVIISSMILSQNPCVRLGRRSVCQSSHTQHTDAYIERKTAEHRPTLSAETTESELPAWDRILSSHELKIKLLWITLKECQISCIPRRRHSLRISSGQMLDCVSPI